MKILVNQVGYIAKNSKRVVVQCDKDEAYDSFSIIDMEGKSLFEGRLEYQGSVSSWNKGVYYTGDFSSFTTPGSYKIVVGEDRERIEISSYLVNLRLISANTAFFKAQRSSGEWYKEDWSLPFNGPREGRMDLHGGWFDASGDHGIHLSHLSHSTWYNPQQMGLSAYFFFKAYDYIEKKNSPSYTVLKKRILDEGSWGLDFLVRCHAPSGSFIRSIRRNEDPDHMEVVKGTRSIGFDYHSSSDQFHEAESKDEEVIDDTYYETSLRSGGAMAIAALALGSCHETVSLDYDQNKYLSVAEEAYGYLVENNWKYTNDGEWNIVDYYTTLIASTELYAATENEKYLLDARCWSERVMESSVALGSGERRFMYSQTLPFHHASDEGLPVIALLLYAEREKDEERKRKAIAVCEEVSRHLCRITNSVTNPFSYPMEEVGDGKGCVKCQFFFPHETSVSPWWQGENARLASISSALYMLSKCTDDKELAKEMLRISDGALDWIMGQNPFDSCMIEGFGRNNPEYFFLNKYDYMNIPGGIVNGITSKMDDEADIDLILSPTEDVSDNWRWAEQWIPHVSWFMFAKSLRPE